ncbi:spectrin beta chain, non-erythrocytic 4 isoform X2 [Struthio camelus]|uniref:spectrin beta chain, non-erythrocytic 4 isoform X2 n=1 Tax=Struthio camelus TaxID=8801 RepID=UPI0036040B6A
MSGSTARKVQPFTISTKLSLPKCAADFSGDACPGIALSSALDNHRGLRHNLNERISLYLAQARASPAPPDSQPRSTSPVEEGVTDEDQLNRNSLARSIKKITLSNWHGEAGSGDAGGPGDPARTGGERNHNNNNSRPGKAQFKVFLRKEVDVEEEKQEAKSPHAGGFCSPVDRGSPFYALTGGPAVAPRRESPKSKEPAAATAPKSGGRSSAGPANLFDLSPSIAQFNREMLQAEGWVRGKLRDLKDGCDMQDLEQVAQTLQRDMKDFENTLIKLNQMGEQLMGRPSPSAETVRRQLLALREQWQLLRQTAASQSKALGGLRSLQDFTRKAEQLEAWIRQKEEKPSLAALLQESLDKIQLTRRILDLKQEEQQFQSLHEELNGLGQKLEKQGKSESRSISARRKHLNKMWLRLQGTLKEHHEALQLALEVAAFLQQADTLLAAIHAKWRSVCDAGKQGEAEPGRDRDVRDMASQVMMLDVTVSQLLSLQPSLAAQVTHKHRDVKESWAQLQQVLRNEKSPALAPSSSFSRGEAAALNHESRGDGSSHGAAGKEAGDKQKRGPGSTVQKDVGRSVAEHARGEESGPGCPTAGQPPPGSDSKRRKRVPGRPEGEWGTQQPEAQVQDFCQAANAAMSRLKENVGPSIHLHPMEDAESLEAAQTQRAALQREILDNTSSIEAVLLEGQKLLGAGARGSPQVEAMLQELGELWEDLQRKHQENGAVLREIDKALRLVGELDRAERWLQAVAGSLSEPAAMRSPEELRRDLEETGQLERQLLVCGLRLQALREEVADEPATEHEAARKMQKKVEMVEEKLARVQTALRRRAADLRDSLVLSEFLQNVQEEEEARSRHQPAPPGSGHRHSQGSLPLLSAPARQLSCSEDMSSPLGQLQEAVEMLNDAVKERERVVEAAAEMESLERLLAEVSPCLEAIRCRAEALARDTAQAENDFAVVKSEKDLQGLQGLLSRQQEMECAVTETLQGQLEELERAAARLEKLCPARMRTIGPEVQGALQAWEGLQKLLRENKAHVQQAGRLRQFFKDYLAMISWTEDTRAQIFSESPGSHGFLDTQCEELERKIEGKLKEFEELAAAGQTLVSEEHYLSETIKERMEELQSMLGWVLVRWRAQKHQRDPGTKLEDRKNSENPLDAREKCVPCVQSCAESMLSLKGLAPCSLSESAQGSELQLRVLEETAISPPASPLSDALLGLEPGSSVPHGTGPPAEEGFVWDPSETSMVLLPPRGTSSLGGTVNLILSIGKKGEKKQPQLASGREQPGEEAPQMLSATKPSSCKTFWKRCQGLLGNTWGSLKRKRKPSRQSMEEASASLPAEERDGEKARKSSAVLQAAKQVPAAAGRPPASSAGAAAASHTLPKAGPSSIFNSLQRKEKAKAEHARLLTLQGIMGPSSLQPLPEERHGPSNTWPLKCGRRKAAPEAPGARLEELLLYVKNPLVRDIDAECGAAPGHPKPGLPHRRRRRHGEPAAGPPNACPHLSLGSVLSLELPKDLAVLGCLRGAAAARQEEAEGDRKRPGRGAKRWEAAGASEPGWQEEDADGHGPQGPGEGLGKPPKGERGTWFEEVSFNPSYRRQKARGLEAARCAGQEARSPGSSGEGLLDSRLNRLSHVSVLHEQVGRERDELAARLGRDGSPGAAAAGCKARLREAARVELRPSPTTVAGRVGTTATGAARPEQPAGSGKPGGEVLAGLCGAGQDSPPAASQGPRAAPQLSVFACELGCRQRGPETPGPAEICHPAHRLFEEEEEELQAIWDQAEEQMAPSPQAESGARRLPASGTGSLQSPDVAGGPLILSATNNVLVAKFTLPTPAQLLHHGPAGEKGPGDRHKGSGSPSRRGAALPCVEEPHGTGQAVSVAWADGPGARDRHPDGEREGSKAPPSKTEFQMMEGTLERKHVLQTGGRKATCRAWSLFHAVLMRQTLCFYQDRRDSLKSSVVALPLNLSGAICTPDTEYTKKTNCFRLQLRDGSEYLLRAPSQLLMNEWVSKLQQNSGFPEVDYFQAAAQSVEGASSAVGKVPGPGSCQLQGHPQAVTAKNQEVVVLPCSNTRLQLPFGSQDGPVDVAASSAEGVRGAASHSAGHREHQWSPSGSPGSWDNSCPDDDYGLVANKRRSYSFTSATYQKITPVAVPKEPMEAGSSYSVTLYIGEQAPAVPRTRCHSFVARPGSPREVLGEKTQGPPRPKNKSVFKKFFGKKE